VPGMSESTNTVTESAFVLLFWATLQNINLFGES
jgi:hypothetical protein